MSNRSKLIAGACALVAVGIASPAHALLSFNVDGGTFNGDTNRYNAAVFSLTQVVNRYNVYGDFGNYNIYAFYNAGIPTAQADYLGSIGFGGTYPNERVTQHESNHYLGSGTINEWYDRFNSGVWSGSKVKQLIQQFDGEGSDLRPAGVHFYQYGLNYDSEVYDDATYMRNVAIMYAMRQDMGVGNQANPWSATNVTLTASDPAGRSAFNWFGGGWSGNYQGWSDKYFAHSGAAYSTGSFDIRTPNGVPSWKFYGDSLTVNAGGRLLFNGYGTTGVVTVNNLILDGGTVRHDQFPQDLFQLAGNITLKSTSTIEAANGNIRVIAPIGGTGGLTLTGGYTTTLDAVNTYTGVTNVNSGTLVINAGGAAGGIRGPLNIASGATARLGVADALGTGAGTSVSQVNVNGGTLDNASGSNSGGATNFVLTGGTMTSSGGGAFNVNAGAGRSISSLASATSSSINANIAIRGANSVLPINVSDGVAANDLVIRGAITNSPAEPGANGVTKNGAGTLLLAGKNTYSGTTTVAAGTLAFATSRSNIGPVAVADGAALRVASLGLAANQSTLNATAITLGGSGGASLTLDFASADSVTPLITTGTLTANGNVNLNIENGGVLSSGSHLVVGYSAFAGGGTFSPAAFALGPRSTGTLVNDSTGGGLLLDVLSDRPIWTGADNGTWAAGLSGVNKNWKLQSNAAATDYLEGDNVLFDDAAESTAINITGGTVSPSATTFNNSSKAYTVTSTGGFGIAGAGALVKNGTNTLTINTPNTYAGGTTVNGGRLVAGNATALGTGGLKLNGAAFGNSTAATVAGPLAVTGNSTIGFAGQNGDLTINGGLSGNGTLTNFVGSANSYSVLFNGDLSGFTGTINFTCDSGAGTGWWRFGASNAIANLANATLVINKGNVTNLGPAASKNVGFSNGITNGTVRVGALSGDGAFQASFNNFGPNTLEVGNLNLSTTFSGVIAGGDGGTNINLTKVGLGTLTLSGANRYTGTTTINAGTIVANTSASLGADTAPLVINGGVLRTTGGIATARSVTVGPNGGTLNVAAIGTAGNGQFYLGAANTLLGSGPLILTGNGALNTTGAGNLRIGSTNPYSGVAILRDGGIFEYGTGGAVGGGASFVIGNEGELAVQGGGATSMPNPVTVSGGTNSVLSFENGGAGNVTGPVTLNANLTVALRNWYNYSAVQSGTIGGVIGGGSNITVNSGAGTGGTLSLNGNNVFTGNLAVSNATVAATLGINDFTNGGRASGALGNEKIAGRTVSVNNGGTVALATGNVLGSGGSSLAQAPALTFVVNSGGALVTTAGTVGGAGGGDANILGPLTLNGGRLTTGNGYDANYQAVILLKNVTVGGTSVSTISTNASNTVANGIMLGDSASGTDTITFNVADATGNANVDLIVAARLTNSANSASNTAALGALAKTGPGTMAMTGVNTYTGGTIVQGGTLSARFAASNASAATTLLSGVGTDVQNGRAVFDYTGSTTPAATVRLLLAASFQAATTPGVMDTGILRSTTATAARGLGYKDDGVNNLIVMATLFGDSDLDGGVSINDFNALAGNFGQSGNKVWTDGDFDYDGGVSINDFNLLAGNFGQTLPASSEAWAGLIAFARAHDDMAAFEAITGVPEPTTLGLVAAGMALGRRRRSA